MCDTDDTIIIMDRISPQEVIEPLINNNLRQKKQLNFVVEVTYILSCKFKKRNEIRKIGLFLIFARSEVKAIIIIIILSVTIVTSVGKQIIAKIEYFRHFKFLIY